MGIPTSLSGAGTPLPQHDYNQIDSSAAAATARQMAGIVANSLDVTFLQLGGNLWKYQSSSENPLLPMFTDVSLAYETPFDDSESTASEYNRLLAQLPQDLATELQMNNRSPADEQDSALSALENFLKYAATLLNGLHQAVKVDPEQSAERTAQNKDLVNMMMTEIFYSSKQLLQSIVSESARGSTDTGSKADVTDVANRLMNVIENFKSQRAEIDQVQGEKVTISQQLMADLSKDANAINVLNDELKKIAPHGMLNLIGETVSYGMLLMCSGKAVGLVAASHIAMTGSNSDKATSAFGSSLEGIINGVALNLEEGPSKNVVKNLTTSALTLMTALISPELS